MEQIHSIKKNIETIMVWRTTKRVQNAQKNHLKMRVEIASILGWKSDRFPLTFMWKNAQVFKTDFTHEQC